ncbi:hypothetical protein V2J09_011867 [Rumex salicifolius]
MAASGIHQSGENGARVVIVGGGIAGSLIAKTLQSDSHLTLIDSKDYFEITWTQLRNKVEPSFAEKSVIKHTDYLTNSEIIISKAVSVTESEVLTEDGNRVPYDYLVIASGHSDSYPKTKSDRLHQYNQEHEKIKAAESILIVGGGPTGVELAGEIACDYPEKKVTLVHKGVRLLEFIGERASTKALDWLTSKKVEVILGQKINLDDPESLARGIYETSNGEKIQADCHFLCLGTPLSSSWLKGSFLEGSLDQNGSVKVDQHLRVAGLKNVFAIGDITDLKEAKQGYLAQSHAQVTAKNLKIMLKGENESKLKKYKPSSMNIAIVSLGRNSGVAQLPFVTLSGCAPGYIKSKDLFVGKTRKSLGLKANSTSENH